MDFDENENDQLTPVGTEGKVAGAGSIPKNTT